MLPVKMMDYVEPDENGARMAAAGRIYSIPGCSARTAVNRILNEGGTSLEGARDAGKSYLGVRYKIPVRIGTNPPVFLFPTRSEKETDCVCAKKPSKEE